MARNRNNSKEFSSTKLAIVIVVFEIIRILMLRLILYKSPEDERSRKIEEKQNFKDFMKIPKFVD